MVDNSNYLVAVWNGKSSGTGHTIKYAMEKGKEVYYIDTVNFLMNTHISSYQRLQN